MSEFGLTQRFWPKQEPVECGDPEGLCGRPIAYGHAYWVDERGTLYCDDCGKAKRFARKREAMRTQTLADETGIV